MFNNFVSSLSYRFLVPCLKRLSGNKHLKMFSLGNLNDFDTGFSYECLYVTVTDKESCFQAAADQQKKL